MKWQQNYNTTISLVHKTLQSNKDTVDSRPPLVFKSECVCVNVCGGKSDLEFSSVTKS